MKHKIAMTEGMRLTCSTVAILLPMSTIVLAASPSDAASPVTVRLTKIQETRRVTLAKHDPSKPQFEFDKPGLALTFSVTPPNGKQLLRAEQPMTVTATDSSGMDLSAIETGILGTKTYVELIQTYGEPPSKFSFNLAPPARDARHFSLKAAFNFWAFTDIKELSFTPTAEEAPLDPALFDGQRVTASLQSSGKGVQLTIRPGSAKHRLEDVELVHGDKVMRSLGAMWNESAVVYKYETPLRPGMKIRAKVRLGVTRHPCTVELTDVELP